VPEAPGGRARVAGVLAGSYAPASAAGIRRFRLDVERGEFVPVAGRSGVPFPAYLTRSAISGCYFAVSETTACAVAGPGTGAAQAGVPGTVWALGPDPAVPDPGEPARALPAGGDLPTHLAVHPSGGWLAVSNYGCGSRPGSVSIFRVGPDGALAGPATRREHAGRGPVRSRQDCAHVHSTMFTAAGDRLIAADLGADVLVVYGFDARDGRLSVVSATPVPPGWGPRYMLPGPGERTLLVVGELACELAAFAFDGDTLELVTRVSTVGSRRGGAPAAGVPAAGVPAAGAPAAGALAADIHASPDGRRVYVSNRGPVNTIATFDTTLPHRPELIGETASGGTWPRHFAVAPDGRFLVVANEHSGQLTALAVDHDGVAGTPLASVAMPGVSYVEVEAA
jgi:6-phosphogluconolactonase